MKQKITAFLLVFCLFSSYTIGEAMANFERSEKNEMIHEASIVNGGPVEIMPPQLGIMPFQ